MDFEAFCLSFGVEIAAPNAIRHEPLQFHEIRRNFTRFAGNPRKCLQFGVGIACPNAISRNPRNFMKFHGISRNHMEMPLKRSGNSLSKCGFPKYMGFHDFFAKCAETPLKRSGYSNVLGILPQILGFHGIS